MFLLQIYVFTLIIDDERKHNACLFFVSSHNISVLVLVVIGAGIFSILKKISVQLQWRCVHGLLAYL
jgi:hypothetical protein